MKSMSILLVLMLALLLSSFCSILFGAAALPIDELLNALFGFQSDHVRKSTAIILWQIRLPRLLTGWLVGSSLALTGSMMQGVFRNPLADPYLLGIAGGATSGAAACIAMGWGGHTLLVTLGAFVGALGAVSLVFLIAQSRLGQLGHTTLILVGIAVGAMFSALTSFLTYFAEGQALQQIVFWSMGDLGAGRWSQLLPLGLLLVACGLPIWALARELDALTLGDDMAQHLGISPTKTRLLLLGLGTLLTAAVVAVAGTIGFVGLIIPHMMRLICGPQHRLLLPASALAGALFLVLCDTSARLLMRPLELPVGLITSLFGAPFFLYLLRHQTRPR